LVIEHGADYVMSVKDNQPMLRQNIEKLIPVVPTGFSPSPIHAAPGADSGNQ
jgi:hypothetical protein